MDILLIAVVGTLNIVCFLIGAKVGQTVAKGKDIEVPFKSPFKAYEERQERKEAEKEQQKLDAIIRNLERYDGTDSGQEDIPS